MKIAIIAFDFDGVIVDTTYIKSEVFVDLFSGFAEYPQVMQYEKEFGSLPRQIKIQHVVKEILKIDESQIEYYLKLYKKNLEDRLQNANLVAGVATFLDSLKKKKMTSYIVSSAPKEEIEQCLKKYNLSAHFAKIYDGEVQKDQALAKIADIESVNRSEILFIGDNISDQQAALKAGTAFVAINTDVSFSSEVQKFLDFNSFDWSALR